MKRWWLVVSAASVAIGIGEARAEEAPVEPAPPDAGLTQEDIARRTGVIAKVGDYGITIGEYEDQLNKQGPFRRVQYAAPEKRREFLDQMVDWELQAIEADHRGLGNDEAVEEQMKRVMSSLLLRREVDDRVQPTDITAEELRAYYDEHITTFKRPERVRAYHIVVSDQAKAQSLLKRILDENVDTREFRRLAREESEDPVTKRRGGDLRYFTRPGEKQEGDPDVAAEVVKASFEMLEKRRAAQAKGQKAPPPAAEKIAPEGDEEEPESEEQIAGFNPVYPKLVKTAQGFHIVRFMGHREAVSRDFAEVERQIRNRLWREKLQKAREDFIEGLREKHRVTIDAKNLELVKVDTSAPGPQKGPAPMRPGIRPGKAPGMPTGERPIEEGVEGNPQGIQELNE
jgi:hypothetical protein